MKIIDFHTHAFPDNVAAKAVPQLAAGANVEPRLDGTVRSLLASMDKAGIARSVIGSIATRPEQFDSILRWSASIASDRIVPFASVHPADPAAVERIHQVRAAGLKGIKLHPYYQQFTVDEARMWPLYEAMEREGLILLCHAGFDIGFPQDRIADPVRTRHVIEDFPKLNLVAAHMGAWDDWAEVRRHLLGQPVYMDISYSLNCMDPAAARELILGHGRDRVLFGSDSPWEAQEDVIHALRALKLDSAHEEAILGRNAEALLGAD